jgi:hypothetical protein
MAAASYKDATCEQAKRKGKGKGERMLTKISRILF